jgi:hypothetical protein
LDHAGDVATRPCQACDDTLSDGIGELAVANNAGSSGALPPPSPPVFLGSFFELDLLKKYIGHQLPQP